MKAIDILHFNSKPKVCVAQSKIDNAGKGLFANQYIPKNTPVVIYYGDLIDNEQLFDIYKNNPNKYFQLNDYIRGNTLNVVIGGKNVRNSNLMGVYVNDISSIKCTKHKLDTNILKTYVQTHKKCNLFVVDTIDYPVYVSNRDILAGEELYVHYGIGYWLLHMRFAPDKISDLNSLYDFASLY